MYSQAIQKNERIFEPVIAKLAYENNVLDDSDDLIQHSGLITTFGWVDITSKSPYKSIINTSPLANQTDDFFSDFEEAVGPLIQNDLTNSNDIESQELIFRIKTTPNIPDRSNIAKRLLDLFQYSKEDDPDFIGIREGSLKSFYNFLCSYTNLKSPSISLTPDNNIYASWKGENGRVFSIHFLADSDVRFVIFTPNKKHYDRMTRTSGATTFDMLMETEVKAYYIYEWISK